jgi:hypothetical protein
MLELKNVGEVIASRDLTLDETITVTVQIGKPQQLADIDWYCPYQKIGIGSGKVKRAEGVDPVQALAFALSMLGAELYCSQEYEAGRLSWDGGAVKGDLEFPVPPNIQDVLPHGAAGSTRNPNTGK